MNKYSRLITIIVLLILFYSSTKTVWGASSTYYDCGLAEAKNRKSYEKAMACFGSSLADICGQTKMTLKNIDGSTNILTIDGQNKNGLCETRLWYNENNYRYCFLDRENIIKLLGLRNYYQTGNDAYSTLTASFYLSKNANCFDVSLNENPLLIASSLSKDEDSNFYLPINRIITNRLAEDLTKKFGVKQDNPENDKNNCRDFNDGVSNCSYLFHNSKILSKQKNSIYAKSTWVNMLLIKVTKSNNKQLNNTVLKATNEAKKIFTGPTQKWSCPGYDECTLYNSIDQKNGNRLLAKRKNILISLSFVGQVNETDLRDALTRIFQSLDIQSGIIKDSFLTKNSTLANKYKGAIIRKNKENNRLYYISTNSLSAFWINSPNLVENISNSTSNISSADLDKIALNLDFSVKIDSDKDGLDDDFELAIGTKTDSADTDNDSHNDRQEIINGYNPNGKNKLLLDQKTWTQYRGKFVKDKNRPDYLWFINPTKNQRSLVVAPNRNWSGEVLTKQIVDINNSDFVKLQK